MVTTDDIVHVLKTSNLKVPETGIQTEAPLVKQGLDSLDMAELMLALEKKYKRVISVEDGARLRTVKDIVDFLNA